MFGVNGKKPSFLDRILGRNIISVPKEERVYTTLEDGTSIVDVNKLFDDRRFKESADKLDAELKRVVVPRPARGSAPEPGA